MSLKWLCYDVQCLERRNVAGNGKYAENLADFKGHKLGTFLYKAYTIIDNSYFKHELQVNVKLDIKDNKNLNFKLIHLKFKPSFQP